MSTRRGGGGCCRKTFSRLQKQSGLKPGPAATIIGSRARLRGERDRDGEEVKPRPRPTGLCEHVKDSGDKLELAIKRGYLTVSWDGRSWELFSSARSQGCEDLIRDLRTKWSNLRDNEVSELTRRLGASFTLADLKRQLL